MTQEYILNDFLKVYFDMYLESDNLLKVVTIRVFIIFMSI